MEDILALKKEMEEAGLKLSGIESVNIHDAIKVGTPDRDKYIDNYITTLERMARVKELFEMYKDVNDDKLFENLKYFLERIMPTCDKYDINMAIHPDDPARSVFGLPRIIINKENIYRMIWDEVAMPGYGLYDRALGATYLNGLWEAIQKSHK